MDKRETVFQLYVYTAVDGYEWQGCAQDRELSAGLDRLMSDTSVRNALPDPNIGIRPDSWIGGVVQGKLKGRPGTAVWRVHIRSFGERNGRLNRYIALLFLPRDEIDPRLVDFARLWEAPLLAEPQKDGLADLRIDLADPACPCLVHAPAEDSSPDIPESAFKKRDEWLARSLAEMSGVFHSSETQFGTMAANVRPGKDGGEPRVRLRYTPFPAVEEAANLRSRLSTAPTSRREALALANLAETIGKSLQEVVNGHEDAPLLRMFATDFSNRVSQFREQAEAIPAPQPQSSPSRPATPSPASSPPSSSGATATRRFDATPSSSHHTPVPAPIGLRPSDRGDLDRFGRREEERRSPGLPVPMQDRRTPGIDAPSPRQDASHLGDAPHPKPPFPFRLVWPSIVVVLALLAFIVLIFIWTNVRRNRDMDNQNLKEENRKLAMKILKLEEESEIKEQRIKSLAEENLELRRQLRAPNQRLRPQEESKAEAN